MEWFSFRINFLILWCLKNLSRIMNPTQKKVFLSFEQGILTIRFAEHVVIEAEDIIYMYCFGLERSAGKPFAVLFDSSANHELSEDAIVYLASGSHIQNITEIAYVSKTLISKIRLNLFLIFERPLIRPKVFETEDEAYAWLEKKVHERVSAAV
jgi:hypothetical protein